MTEMGDRRPPPSSAEKAAVAIVVVATAGFAVFGAATGADSPIGYVASVVVVAALILWLRTRPLPAVLAIALAVDAVAHLAGGLVHLNGSVLYDASIGPLVTSADTHLLQYDHVVHAYGSFVATLALWVILVPPGLDATYRRNLLVLCLLAGVGIGAANESIEFVATLLHHGQYVGGYNNTGWDLIFNTLGAVMATVLLVAVERRRTRPA
jgi:uncharacterized membrane protein YjdF